MKLKGVSMLAAIAIFSLPVYATADVLDVLTVKLNKKCSVEQYQSIVDDINAHFKDRGWTAELLLPLHSQEQDSVFVVGRSSNVEALGRVIDYARAEQQEEGSTVSKLIAQAQKCGTLTSRASFVTTK